MIEAFLYGTIAALCFIGFISIIYYVVLYIYRPKKYATYIISIPKSYSGTQIRNLIYGVHLRNMLFGELLGQNVYIFKDGLSEMQVDEINLANKDFTDIELCSSQEIIERLKQNGREFD